MLVLATGVIVGLFLFFRAGTVKAQTCGLCNGGKDSTCSCGIYGQTRVAPCCDSAPSCRFLGFEGCHVDPSGTGCVPTGCAGGGGGGGLTCNENGGWCVGDLCTDENAEKTGSCGSYWITGVNAQNWDETTCKQRNWTYPGVPVKKDNGNGYWLPKGQCTGACRLSGKTCGEGTCKDVCNNDVPCNIACPSPTPPPQYPVCDSLNVAQSGPYAPATMTINLTGHTVNGGVINTYGLDIIDPTGKTNHYENTTGKFSISFNLPGNYQFTGTVIDNLGKTSICKSTSVTLLKPPLSCNLTLYDAPTNDLVIGEIYQALKARVDLTNSTDYNDVKKVEFTSSNGQAIQIDPAVIDWYVYNGIYGTDLNIKGVAKKIFIKATATLRNGKICFDEVEINSTWFPAWWQANQPSAYGDIFAFDEIKDPIFTDLSTFLDLGNNPAKHSAAVATNRGTTGFPTPDLSGVPVNKLNSAMWKIKTNSLYPVGQAGQYLSYDYWYKYLGGDSSVQTMTDNVNSANYLDDHLTEGIYTPSPGPNLHIHHKQQISAGKYLIILVPGNLYIDYAVSGEGTWIERTDPTAFIAFIVKGNIIIANGLQNGNNPLLDGVYIAQGKFQTGTSIDYSGDKDPKDPNNQNKQFRGRGIFAAGGGFTLDRDLTNLNNKQPAEIFDYDPSLVLNAPAIIRRSHYTWAEIAP